VAFLKPEVTCGHHWSKRRVFIIPEVVIVGEKRVVGGDWAVRDLRTSTHTEEGPV